MRLQTLLITLFLTIYSSNLFSTNSVNVDSSNTEAVQHGVAYDPVETIMHHVQDAHEFPIIGDLA